MSDWRSDSQTDGISSSEWLRKIGVVEQELRKIKSEGDHVEQVLHQLRAGQGDPDHARDRVHFLTSAAQQLCKDILILEKLSQSGSSWDAAEKKTRVRRLHEQALGEMTRLQRFSSDLHSVYERIKSGTAAQTVPPKLPRPPGSGFDPLQDISSSPGPFGEFGGGQHQLTRMADPGLADQEQQERDMRLLEDDIEKVNEVFTTLAGFVHEQGSMVDSIEANTEAAQVQVSSGNEQLSAAVRHRNAARRKKCILAIIIMVILAIIILIIVISVKAK